MTLAVAEPRPFAEPLERLKKAEIVRVIDLLLVRKDGMGNVMVTTASDLDWQEAVSFGSYVGALALRRQPCSVTTARSCE